VVVSFVFASTTVVNNHFVERNPIQTFDFVRRPH